MLKPFQCAGKLFKVHYWHLTQCSSALLRLIDPNTDGARGTSDDTAIPIDDLVSAGEFVTFLDFIYTGFVPVNHEQQHYSAYVLFKRPSRPYPDKRVV